MQTMQVPQPTQIMWHQVVVETSPPGVPPVVETWTMDSDELAHLQADLAAWDETRPARQNGDYTYTYLPDSEGIPVLCGIILAITKIKSVKPLPNYKMDSSLVLSYQSSKGAVEQGRQNRARSIG